MIKQPPALPVDKLAATWTPVVAAQEGPCRLVRDGETIAVLQGVSNELLTWLTSNQPSFGGAWFEHAPCYRLVLAFAGEPPQASVLEAADPALRPFLAFARARFSNAQREQARHEISSALIAAGVEVTIVGESVHPERLTFGVPTQADAEKARRAIPERYRSMVTVEVGDFRPRPERF